MSKCFQAIEPLRAYMAEIATSLREARDIALKEEPLKEYTPVFEWVEGVRGKFTIRISMHPDTERIANPVATITFPGTLPDFDKPNPQIASDKLKTWLKPGSDAVRGLVAQERNTRLHSQIADEFVALRKRNGGSPSVTLLDKSRAHTVDPEIVSSHAKIYLLQEIAREQESSLPLAREGLPIPEDKYQAFLSPEKYASNVRSYVNLGERFRDLQSRSWPPGTMIAYNPNERVFQLTFAGSSRLLGGGEAIKKEVLKPSYTNTEVGRLLEKVGAGT